jgi:lipoprotein-anchoring transpeptidase ErfK/SrfK
VTRSYYTLLLRAIAALDSDTKEDRSAVYNHARNVIAAAGLSSAELEHERSALEAAIERIEAERGQPSGLRRRLSLGPAEVAQGESASPPRFPRAWLVIGVLVAALFVTGVVVYAPWTRKVTPSGDPAKQTGAAIARVDPVKPARSNDFERSYIFNRQLVYYRTIHPAGTVLIAKAQRFLYVAVSNVSAIRYTVGVGRECTNVAGLLLVSAKEEWPVGPAQRVSDPRQSGGRFGARSLALSDTGHRIHGTNATTRAGEDGCFPLVNDDIIHLYDRVAVGTRVVIN